MNFLREQQRRLVEMRREALGTLEVGRREAADLAAEDGRDPADLAEKDVEASARFQIAGHGFDLLREIDDALARIRRGVYGVCELTGSDIPIGRLKALPFARYTMEAQASLERQGRGSLRVSVWSSEDEDKGGEDESNEQGDADTTKTETEAD